MSDEEPPDYDDIRPPDEDGKVLVFRGAGGNPVVVPSDIATEADRAYRAHKARIIGKSWDEIAHEEQWPSAAAAQAAVKRWQAEAAALVTASSQREHLELEVARIDALQAAIWPQAMMGHVPSATAALSMIVQRSRLIGLDPEKMNEDGETARTVVVPQESSSYIDALKRAAGETPPVAPPAVP